MLLRKGMKVARVIVYFWSVFSRFNAIWVIPNSWYVTMRIYFQAQGPLRLGRDGQDAEAV